MSRAHPDDRAVSARVSVGSWAGPIDVAAHYMDDDLRERAHDESADDAQAFVDRYAALHRERFGEDFHVG